MAEYRAGVRLLREREARELAQREARAWELARRAAVVLREQFDATRVAVFGSLVVAGSFNPWSDVDIAAWGLRVEDTFRAIGVVMDLDVEIELNLVDTHTCSASMRAHIERQGIDI